MDELGVPVQLRDADTVDDLGLVHASGPVRVGDLVCLEHGSPLRIVHVMTPLPGAVALTALARPERLPLVENA